MTTGAKSHDVTWMTVIFLLATAALVQTIHRNELVPARSDLRRARVDQTALDEAVREARQGRDLARLRLKGLECDPPTVEAALRERGYTRPDEMPLRVVQKHP